MKTHLSEKNCWKLKEWNCDVPYTQLTTRKLEESDFLDGKIHPNVKKWGIPAYDLRDIICDGEMAKKFFGEKMVGTGLGESPDSELYLPNYEWRSWCISSKILNDEKAKAEEYFMANTIFNPLNK